MDPRISSRERGSAPVILFLQINSTPKRHDQRGNLFSPDFFSEFTKRLL